MNSEKLRLQQLDQTLGSLNAFRGFSAPSIGWLATIRAALGRSLHSQARAKGVRPSSILINERNEVKETISLRQLRKVADDLGCDLVYALVPRQPLFEQLQVRAEEIARAEILASNHSMALENQRPDTAFQKQQIEDRKRELLDGNWKRLWP